MSRSIAGAKYTGHLAERKTDNRKLSHRPCAIFERVWAEAGAMISTSAQRPRAT